MHKRLRTCHSTEIPVAIVMSDMGREMKRPTSKFCFRVFLRCLIVSAFLLLFLYICKEGQDSQECNTRIVDPEHVQRAKTFARDVLQAQCRPAFARTQMDRLFSSKYTKNLSSFIKKDKSLNESLYKYEPPFGFRHYVDELSDLLEMMPEDGLPKELHSKHCKRCIVIGSGGILHGLELGQMVDQFDIVIRLNNAPVHGYAQDVGNKTTIRMTYPEGAPVSEQEYQHSSLFVTVLFKHADFRWLEAVLKNQKLSAWNRFFFWKRVTDKIPLNSSQFRVLNPLIIKETAIDILGFPKPQKRWLGWDKNVPTIGMTAVILATHLCDEVNLAGFGYDLSQPDASLHYYDNRCMNSMNDQPMHDVTKEKKMLRTLVKEGVVRDLSGGIHCAFCDTQHYTE